jgi:hypothetical protein
MQDPDHPTLICQKIAQLQRELAQAYVVSDAINTLLENSPGVTIGAINGMSQVYTLGTYCEADTLREALEACVEARDQHDKERKEQ